MIAMVSCWNLISHAKFNSLCGNLLTKQVPDAFSINGIEIDLKELEELEKRVAAKKQSQAAAAATSVPTSSRVNENLEESFEKSLKITDGESSSSAVPAVRQQPSLASMFLVLMGIFSILNQIYYKPTAQS
jgi:hypothetical protein